MSLPLLKYQIYPSLLDKFANYLNSSQIYQQTYGASDEPSVSEEDFEAQKKQELLDAINRVPFESEKADKGTMFNEVIDCLVENRSSEKMIITANKELNIVDVVWNNKEPNRTFTFNLLDCRKIAKELDGAICQNYKEGFIETKYGFVKLYGFSDFLMPFNVVDLKTTSNYKAFKYKDNWQRIVYPFLLHFNGEFISNFTFLVYKWTKNGGEIYTEEYTYSEFEDLPKLVEITELFIEFLESHRGQITDKKIFNVK